MVDLGFHERSWINNYDGPKLIFYRRHVDDIFCIFHSEKDARQFLNISIRNIQIFLSLMKKKKTANFHSLMYY